MLYFAYGSNLNAAAVMQWCHRHGYSAPPMTRGRPAVLDDYRVDFPNYNERWGGGTADIVRDPGKRVNGVLFELGDADLLHLDEKAGRRLDHAGREVGPYRRIEVDVMPIAKGSPVRAFTYKGTGLDHGRVAPSGHYLDIVIQGARAHGLPPLWVSSLRGFHPTAHSPKAAARCGAGSVFAGCY